MRREGIWTALEAFEKFSKLHPEVKLYVVGDGPLLKKLPSWIKTHGLDGRVELTGFVSAARKYELLSSSLALLQTSFKEGWGLTVMEAAQLCKTTIASDVPGLCDSVRDGETGMTFRVGMDDLNWMLGAGYKFEIRVGKRRFPIELNYAFLYETSAGIWSPFSLGLRGYIP